MSEILPKRTPKRWEDFNTPKQSAAEQFKETAVVMIITLSIFYFLGLFLKGLFAPLRWLFKSDRQLHEEDVEQAKEKVKRRNEVRYDYKVSPGNHFNQYMERFKLHPEKYKNDPDNDYYGKWYEALTNGIIKDSRLLWAPDIYTLDPDGNNMVNEDFLNYFAFQVEYHQNHAKFSERFTLFKTIKDYYPEFTPRFKIIPDEINGMREKIKERNLKYELIDEVEKKGVPHSLARELVNEGITIETLKTNIITIRKCMEFNFSTDMCKFCIDHDFSPEHFMAETVNNCLKSLGEEIALSLIRGNISPDKLNSIMEEAIELYDDEPEKRKEMVVYEFRKLLKEKTFYN